MTNAQPAMSLSRRSVFEKHVPEAFFDAWLRTIAAINRSLHKECETRFSPEMAREVFPQMRRGLLEDEFYKLVQRFGGVPTKSKNSTFSSTHVEGVFGDGKVLVVQHYARDEYAGPRPTGFGLALANQAQQMFLNMDMFAAENAVAKAILATSKGEPPVFAQMVYGPTRRSAANLGIPSFARVLFPAPEKGFFLERPLSLNERLLSLLNKSRSAQETIQDDLQMTPRSLPKSDEAPRAEEE